MDIVALHDAHIPTLYAIYRDSTARAAHCRLVPSLARFATALFIPARANMRLFVAEDAGAAHGFAALVPLDSADDGTTQATISALFVADEAAGQGLLQRCIGDAQDSGIQRLGAFAGNHFRCPVPGYNVGWDGLSDTMPTIARLLVRNGFTPVYRELHLSCDLRRFPPAPEAPPTGLTIERRVPAEGGWKLVPHIDGRSAGVCEYVTLDHVVDDPAAGLVGYIEGLGIAEWARRRGIARHLMNRALAHLVELGCDECWLTTGADNWPAQPLYLSLGFEIVDASTCFQRVLGKGLGRGHSWPRP